MLTMLLALALSILTPAEDLPRGRLIDEVSCQADPSQTYALYLPSNYTPERAWPVIYLFDAGGRGQNAIERYRVVAEQYGYVLAGSNNSRNGRSNAGAITSMPADVTARFHIDPRRVYTGGMSGGARVALGLALDGKVAGVLASSAGYPDAEPRKTLPFALYVTTGTEDFNHLELRKLDRALTTPHRLATFEGVHSWPPPALITEGVEWMELQAMKTRLKPRDEEEVDRLFSKRLTAIGWTKEGARSLTTRLVAGDYLALHDLVLDFDGLRDVAALTKRAQALSREPAVRAELERARAEDDHEDQIVADVQAQEHRLDFTRQRNDAMAMLLNKWEALAAAANQSDDSADRRMARRVMAWLNLNTMTMDEDYREMVREIRAGGARGR